MASYTRYWERRLLRPITLANGERVRTLREAATVVMTTTEHSVPMSAAMTELLQAARSGRLCDRHRANDRLEDALRTHRLI